MTFETYATFRKSLIAEKSKMTYLQLERKYGANRYYLWQIINLPKYMPPAWFLRKNGIVIRRYPPKVAIRTDDMKSASKTIKKYVSAENVQKLTRELEKRE